MPKKAGSPSLFFTETLLKTLVTTKIFLKTTVLSLVVTWQSVFWYWAPFTLLVNPFFIWTKYTANLLRSPSFSSSLKQIMQNEYIPFKIIYGKVMIHKILSKTLRLKCSIRKFSVIFNNLISVIVSSYF